MKFIKTLIISISILNLAACASNPPPQITNGVATGVGKSVTSDKNVVANSVFFTINSAEVSKSYHKLLTINAGYLISHPYSIVQIQGNSSEIGSSQHNHELAMIRAQNVKQALINLGVPAKQISIISYGDTKQLYPSANGGRQPKNQRADIVYTSLPPYQYTIEKLPMINVSTMY